MIRRRDDGSLPHPEDVLVDFQARIDLAGALVHAREWECCIQDALIGHLWSLNTDFEDMRETILAWLEQKERGSAVHLHPGDDAA